MKGGVKGLHQNPSTITATNSVWNPTQQMFSSGSYAFEESHFYRPKESESLQLCVHFPQLNAQ